MRKNKVIQSITCGDSDHWDCCICGHHWSNKVEAENCNHNIKKNNSSIVGYMIPGGFFGRNRSLRYDFCFVCGKHKRLGESNYDCKHEGYIGGGDKYGK